VEERGAKPPVAEALLVFEHSMEAANLPTFLKFGNAKKLDICVIFAKNRGWPQNWGVGPMPPLPRPGPKTCTVCCHHHFVVVLYASGCWTLLALT